MTLLLLEPEHSLTTNLGKLTSKAPANKTQASITDSLLSHERNVNEDMAQHTGDARIAHLELCIDVRHEISKGHGAVRY